MKEEFKKLLNETGLTPKTLAILLGESHDTVKNWSMGRTAIPGEVMTKLKKHKKNTKKVFDACAD